MQTENTLRVFGSVISSNYVPKYVSIHTFTTLSHAITVSCYNYVHI